MPCHAFCQLWPYFSLLKNASRLGWAQIFVFGTGTSVRTLIPCQWWPNAHTLSMSVWCRFIWCLFTLLRSCSKSLICRGDSCNFLSYIFLRDVHCLGQYVYQFAFLYRFLPYREIWSGCKESQFYSLPFGQTVANMY